MEGVDTAARGRWMSVLALASAGELEAHWRDLADPPEFRHVRPPETGLVMVRGRAGGTGARFNLGELTVTRRAVELDGALGHAYVRGRARRHAELAALFDALLQDPRWRGTLECAVVEPLERAQAERRRAVAARVAPARVEFFTMVRGEE